MKKILLLIVLSLILTGCGTQNENLSNHLITSSEAKEKIAAGALLIDVRSQEEYLEGHIEGAMLLPVGSINVSTVESIIPSKDSEIVVYCRSGNRSSQAKEIFNDLGYNNVYDLGSINNWHD